PSLVEDHEAVRTVDAGQDPDQGVDRVRGRLVGEEGGQELPGRPGRGGRAVRSSVSVEAGRRARPPRSWPSSSRVFTTLPLWPIASARRGPRRNVGWAFSHTVEPVVE